MTITPAIHTIEAIGTITCKGFTLSPTSGAKVSAITGLTALLTTRIPELITGCCVVVISCGMTSALGTQLNTLSKENGNIRRIATSAQSIQVIHLGAFFKKRRSRRTASIIQPATRLIFRILRKTTLNVFSPI